MTVRVLFTGCDDRVLAAIAQLVREGTHAVLIADPEQAATSAAKLGVSLAGVEVLGAPPDRSALANKLAASHDVEPWVADRLLDRPVYAALAMLGAGAGDAVVAGVTNHTAEVLIACEMCLGFANSAHLASSAFVMDVPGRGKLVFADCAVNPEPTADQLAAIAIAAADAAALLLGAPPRVALLSFSTHGSAHHARATKVAQATSIARTLRPGLALDGELQADAALDPIIAAHKAAGDGDVAGTANVLVFPDLDAGNIAYKLVRSLARANAYGAFLQGYARPVVKLSRGATIEEVVGAVRLLRHDG